MRFGKLLAISALIGAIAFLALAALRAPSLLSTNDHKTIPVRKQDIVSSQSTPIGQHQPRLPQGKVTAKSNENDFIADVRSSEIDNDLIAQFLSKRRVAEYRVVHIDSDMLRNYIRQLDQEPRLTARFLAQEIPIIAEGGVEHSGGWQSGFARLGGRVANDPFSTVSLVIGPDGAVSGVVRSPTIGRIKIDPIPGTSQHVIWRRDYGENTANGGNQNEN